MTPSPPSRRSTWPSLVLVVLVASLGAVAVGAPTGSAAHAPTVTLSLGPPAGVHYANPFWAVNTGDDLTPKALAGLGNFLNSTPFTWVRLGGGSDSYDPTTGIDYEAPSSGTHYVAVATQLTNFTWFKAWCLSRTPHCLWMTYLPGEENNTAAAVHVAEWFHTVLRFVPTYWEFGNEPNAWTHYGKNRTQWSTTDALTPTGLDYATMVHSYSVAVAKLFPSDRFLGIQANCACNATLVSTTTQVDGSLLSGMAYHSYPWLNGSSTSLSQFYGSLESSRNLPNTTAHFRALMTASCPGCASMPLDVGEYQAGPVPVHSPLAGGYAGAVFMAASVIQALENNVSTFTEFNIGWLLNTSNGAVAAEGLLYQRILDNLTMGTDVPAVIRVPGVGGVFGLFVQNGSRLALFVVNTNTTHSFTLPISSALFGVGVSGSTWSWTPMLKFPAAHRGVTLPSSYFLSPQSILLMTNY